ncbi:hypothetical protein, partial [Christensenella hongkongensis]|uniref:hypothetical protein n=1 Tax=Christensenella hongkongensis TaxID=270498 RepID=UPI001A9A4AAD
MDRRKQRQGRISAHFPERYSRQEYRLVAVFLLRIVQRKASSPSGTPLGRLQRGEPPLNPHERNQRKVEHGKPQQETLRQYQG